MGDLRRQPTDSRVTRDSLSYTIPTNGVFFIQVPEAIPQYSNSETSVVTTSTSTWLEQGAPEATVKQLSNSSDTLATTATICLPRLLASQALTDSCFNSGSSTSSTISQDPSADRPHRESNNSSRPSTSEHKDTDRWGARYNDLLEYRSKYGNCDVQYNYTERQLLYSWVKRQRYQYKCCIQAKPSQLTVERIRALEVIDFSWDTHAKAWEANYELLKGFVRRHTHCQVPSKEPRLFAWVKRQRRQHRLWIANKDSTMTEERYHRLAQLGFHWGGTGNQSP